MQLSVIYIRKTTVNAAGQLFRKILHNLVWEIRCWTAEILAATLESTDHFAFGEKWQGSSSYPSYVRHRSWSVNEQMSNQG